MSNLSREQIREALSNFDTKLSDHVQKISELNYELCMNPKPNVFEISTSLLTESASLYIEVTSSVISHLSFYGGKDVGEMAKIHSIAIERALMSAVAELKNLK